jgi:hypothetical protein
MEENNNLDLNISEIIGEDSDPDSDVSVDPEVTNTDFILGKTCKVSTNSLKNLKPWKKGENPNPLNLGKKGKKYTARARHDLIKVLEHQLELQIPQPVLEKIREYYPKASGKMSSAEAVMLKLQVSALCGEPWATKELLERLHGKSVQPITTQQQISINGKSDDLSEQELRERIAAIDARLAEREAKLHDTGRAPAA